MQCPKCGHQQDNTVECEACGVFFAKYQNRQQQTTHTVIHVERKRSYTLPIAGSIAAGVLIGAYFFHGSSPTPPASQTQVTKQQTIVSPVKSKPIPNKDDQSSQVVVLAPRNEIERARTATVFIKTKWGLGSGFFFTTNCRVLTNRHELAESGFGL